MLVKKTESYHSYPKVYNIGHRAIATLFDNDVHIQEKVDGSQFSFGIYNGELVCCSRNCVIDLTEPQTMFKRAVETVKSLAMADKLVDGWTYRGEVLDKPKHNTLEYERVPNGHIILFDVDTCEECYLKPHELEAEATKLGLEVVPTIFIGRVSSPLVIETLIDRISILGRVKVEGIVIKNYEQFGIDKKCLMGKYVSPDFKEKHKTVWKSKNPSQKDILFTLSNIYKHENRWKKALQRLRESGDLTGTPKDIGALCKEVPADIKAECEDEIKELLFKWAWGNISKNSVAGIAEWYKDLLLQSAFE